MQLHAQYSRKHPRIRGENSLSVFLAKSERETSPHTRGERCPQIVLQSAAGNIPAYAGRTLQDRRCEMRCRKHPRIRGENSAIITIRSGIPETSPHTRGEQVRNRTNNYDAGNIPAYAGRTALPMRVRLSLEKHPRIRGENVASPCTAPFMGETSPHTRGEPVARVTEGEDAGNIPAYAGRTNSLWMNRGYSKKHPRIRGENDWRL